MGFFNVPKKFEDESYIFLEVKAENPEVLGKIREIHQKVFVDSQISSFEVKFRGFFFTFPQYLFRQNYTKNCI